MKNEKLIDAIGLIQDEYVKEAHQKTPKKFTIPWPLILKIAGAACALILVINILPFGKYGASSGSHYDVKEESSSYYTNGYSGGEGMVASESYYRDDEAPAESYAASGSNNSTTQSITQNKKMILTARMNLDTMNLDETVAAITKSVSEFGGYIQQSTNSNRSYEATIRIPADKYADFLKTIEEAGTSTYYTEEIKDITDTYTDLTARLDSLKAQEAKVLEFYDKAESIEDLMAVEERLSEIRYQIESIEASLKNYDLLIAYSTLYLNVRETSVTQPTKQSFFQRLGNAFSNGFKDFIYGVEDFLVDLSYNIFDILFIALLAGVAYFVYRRIKNRKNKKQ